jgi:hypothetical protein
MDWMYAGSMGTVNRDEYLLGKRVDSAVYKAEANDDLKPAASEGATFQSTKSTLTAKDVMDKARGDPMFAIKKKEQEMIRSAMNNPLRMKKIEMVRWWTLSPPSPPLLYVTGAGVCASASACECLNACTCVR